MNETRYAKNLTLIAALAVSIAAGNAVKAEDGGSSREGKRPGFEALDANGDGMLERAELDQHMKARFDAADTDGDGLLSRDELSARAKSRSESRLDRMLNRVDADKDGAVSFEEMRAVRGGKMFERADADGDGFVTRAEFDAAKSRAKDQARSKSKSKGEDRLE
ncbi:MAG: EF-hand domain-containing protein [Pseudomonadota bacterium]